LIWPPNSALKIRSESLNNSTLRKKSGRLIHRDTRSFRRFLGGELSGPFHRGRGGPGGWIILNKPELHLGEDVLVPDLAGWRRERMSELPEGAAFELAPDWVCEVPPHLRITAP